MNEINLYPQKDILLTPEEYLKLVEKDRSAVKSAKIVPPKLGEKGFGKLRVNPKTPTYSNGRKAS